MLKLTLLPVALLLVACDEGRVEMPSSETATPFDAEAFASWRADPPTTVHGMTADAALVTEIDTLYAIRGGEPIWIGAPARTDGLIRRLDNAPTHGLPTERYQLDALREATATIEAGDTEAAYTLELALTRAAMLYARDLDRGQHDPDDMAVAWHVPRPEPELGPRLATALYDGDDLAILDRLAPDHPQYTALQEGLARYRAIAAAGGWPTLGADRVLEPGESAAASDLEVLAERLAAEHYLQSAPTDLPSTYDAPLVDAVKAFQADHGLEPDGVVDDDTRVALNRTVDERVAELQRNLERWRWMPNDLGDTHVWVNVAGFRLEVRERDARVLETGVIVGRENWETPIFADRIDQLVVNPYWNAPRSIASAELIPKGQDWLSANGFEVFDGQAWRPAGEVRWRQVSANTHRLRQVPGPGNALGAIKFRFPNDYSVYLHDTPADQLFDATDRAFSHGCIRVEAPLELAAVLVDDLDRDDIVGLVESNQRVEIAVADPVPIYITYFTAELGADGDLSFHQDVYGIDAAHAAVRSP